MCICWCPSTVSPRATWRIIKEVKRFQNTFRALKASRIKKNLEQTWHLSKIPPERSLFCQTKHKAAHLKPPGQAWRNLEICSVDRWVHNWSLWQAKDGSCLEKIQYSTTSGRAYSNWSTVVGVSLTGAGFRSLEIIGRITELSLNYKEYQAMSVNTELLRVSTGQRYYIIKEVRERVDLEEEIHWNQIDLNQISVSRQDLFMQVILQSSQRW